ncbi:MAG: tRNA U34 5-methylaminomethyl-2-thiouridine-forming methyltransferase MnmC [Flavobacteriaceae bacterium]|jgi:tRNA U34 5-methylaminomethyl-2-thiouridine-forming methyltransferase MnmC
MKFSKQQIITDDGSSTIYIEGLKESYHSKHGAVVESDYIYLKQGLEHWTSKYPNKACRILELGYGTGLMAYLTAQFSESNQKEIKYTSLEAYPLTSIELNELNYEKYFEKSPVLLFKEFSTLSWEELHKVTPCFSFTKKVVKFEYFSVNDQYDIIFYDAFGSHAQPELWTYDCMKKCYDLIAVQGVWVSYCAKGSVRRDLEEIGFEVSRLPGPPGKREMLRGVKV